MDIARIAEVAQIHDLTLPDLVSPYLHRVACLCRCPSPPTLDIPILDKFPIILLSFSPTSLLRCVSCDFLTPILHCTARTFIIVPEDTSVIEHDHNLCLQVRLFQMHHMVLQRRPWQSSPTEEVAISNVGHLGITLHPASRMRVVSDDTE